MKEGRDKKMSHPLYGLHSIVGYLHPAITYSLGLFLLFPLPFSSNNKLATKGYFFLFFPPSSMREVLFIGQSDKVRDDIGHLILGDHKGFHLQIYGIMFIPRNHLETFFPK